jgi:hypothetical protein
LEKTEQIQNTAITTPFGHLEFAFMSLGRRNSTQINHRFMNDILRGLDLCFAYLNDILVFSYPLEENEQHLWVLFNKLHQYGILINPARCFLGIQGASLSLYFIITFILYILNLLSEFILSSGAFPFFCTAVHRKICEMSHFKY